MPRRAGRRPGPRRDGGYVMIVLMIAVAVLAVLLLMAVPLWQTEAQREAEEELIFRARQYVTAIGFYVKAHNNLYPQNFEILHLEKFLRQLYPDPISADGRWDMVFQDTSERRRQVPGRAGAHGPGLLRPGGPGRRMLHLAGNGVPRVPRQEEIQRMGLLPRRQGEREDARAAVRGRAR